MFRPKTVSAHMAETSVSAIVEVRHGCARMGRFIGLRSQVVYSKQPKLGLTQEFVVLLVRMRLVVYMFVCLFVCLIVCLFVCLL